MTNKHRNQRFNRGGKQHSAIFRKNMHNDDAMMGVIIAREMKYLMNKEDPRASAFDHLVATFS